MSYTLPSTSGYKVDSLQDCELAQELSSKFLTELSFPQVTRRSLQDCEQTQELTGKTLTELAFPQITRRSLQDESPVLAPVFLSHHGYAVFHGYNGHTPDERPDTVSNNQGDELANDSSHRVGCFYNPHHCAAHSYAIDSFEHVDNLNYCNNVVLDYGLLKKSVDSIYNASSYS